MELSKQSLVISFAGLCFVNLIASIDSTALSVSLPTIANALHATSIEAYWAGTSFLLSSAVFQPLFAAFSNAFGRKAMLLIALGLFTIGTIVAGTAQNPVALLAGRTVQGAGGGGLLTMTYVVMADLLSLRDRAKGISIISLVWLIGTMTGPILGGGFTFSVSWRWIFWICLPFAGISIVLVGCFLKTSHKALDPTQALKNVDWAGAVIFVASLTSFLVAVSWGGSLFPWTSFHTILPLVLGAAGLVGWVVYEYFIPASPIVPLVIFNNRTNVVVFTGTLLMGIIQFGLLYYLPLYYQVVKGYTPLISGVALLPQCALAGPTTAITGALISKTGKYRLVIWIGWVLLSLGCGLLLLLDQDTTVPQWIFINAVSGLGLGALFASQAVATQAASDDRHMTIAAGLSPFFRAIGQALGIVVGNSITQNQFKRHLLNGTSVTLRTQAVTLAEDLANLRFILNSIEYGSSERDELITALNKSLHSVWWTLTAFGLIAGLLSLLVKQIRLDRPRSQAPNARESLEEAEMGLTAGSANSVFAAKSSESINTDETTQSASKPSTVSFENDKASQVEIESHHTIRDRAGHRWQ